MDINASEAAWEKYHVQYQRLHDASLQNITIQIYLPSPKYIKPVITFLFSLSCNTFKTPSPESETHSDHSLLPCLPPTPPQVA